jgi:hypothetical protein
MPLLLKGMFAPLPVPAHFTKSFPRGMSVRPGQIRAESQDGVAMIPVALAMLHRYQELSMPIVIMAGTKDRVVKDSQTVRLHEQIPHSVLRLIPGVGHMVHYAVPNEVARAIEEVRWGNQRRCSAAPGEPPLLTRRPLHRWPGCSAIARGPRLDLWQKVLGVDAGSVDPMGLRANRPNNVRLCLPN